MIDLLSGMIVASAIGDSLAVRWPIRDACLSEKDRQGTPLQDAPCFKFAAVY